MIKDGKLWAHALEDCVVSACKPLCEVLGQVPVCVGEKEITNHKNQNYMWEVNLLDFVGDFSWQKTQDQ